jgi:hypothetical protein
LAMTNLYAEVDLETKAKGLENSKVKEEQLTKSWREDRGFMEFLGTL